MQDSIESKSELYNKLVEYDDFTEDEAKYAADNVKVDYKENALERAKSLSKDGDTSKSDIMICCLLKMVSNLLKKKHSMPLII